jgi:MYXO-CTERM domain-containing protein
MYAQSGPGALDKRQLAPDDLAGVLAAVTAPTGRDVTPCDPSLTVYDAAAPYCPVQPPDRGGCHGAAPTPALPIALALLALAALARARRRTTTAAVALTVAVCAAPAHAGSPYFTDGGAPLHWLASDVALTLDPVVPANLTTTEFADAFTFGQAQWNKVLAPFSPPAPTLRTAAVTACPGEVVDDRINCVFWTLKPADWRFGKNEVALTLVHFRQTSGEIVDVDMDFNGALYVWSAGDCDPGQGTYDLLGIATHELGHVLGLDHSTDAAATMNRLTFPGNCPQRTLEDDDTETVVTLYTAEPDPAPDGGPEPTPDAGTDATADLGPDAAESPDADGVTGGRGCAGGPSQSGPWLLSLLALAMLATRRGRRAPARAPARS